MNDPRDPQNPGPPTFDIPDLDVSEAGRPVSRAPAPQPSAPAPAQGSNPADNLFGSGMFDDDHFDAGGVGAIDLGSGHGGGYGPGTSGVYSGGALDDLDDD
ncbi:MAG: hypothetical protein KC776_25690, partial [Myxococcales bacterium]|nr:hypothetical protein [Myxococcales bacterium]